MAPVSNIEDTFNLKMNPKPPNLHLLHSVDILPTTTYDHHLREEERSLSVGKEPAIRSNNLRCYRILFHDAVEGATLNCWQKGSTIF